MAFSILRNFGLKVYYGISNTPEVIAQSIKASPFQNLPILSNNIDTTSQLTSVRWRTKVPKRKKTGQFPPDLFKGKKSQDWWEWDGFGPYKPRYHKYPTNWTLRDVQRRRILQQHAEERNRMTNIFRNDILPQELKEAAREQIHKVPRDSAITRVNRRCSITGRGRGIFHQYRVSRMVFREQADYNKISGVLRAKWIKSVHIDP